MIEYSSIRVKKSTRDLLNEQRRKYQTIFNQEMSNDDFINYLLQECEIK